MRSSAADLLRISLPLFVIFSADQSRFFGSTLSIQRRRSGPDRGARRILWNQCWRGAWGGQRSKRVHKAGACKTIHDLHALAASIRADRELAILRYRMVAIRGHTWRICVNWRRKRRQRSAVHRAKRINDGVPFTLSLLCGEQKRQNRD